VKLVFVSGLSRERSGSFWPIRSHVFTSYFGNVWSSGARTSLTDSGHENLNFRRVIYFRLRWVSVFGRIFTFGIAAKLRPPRVRDLRTMEGVDSTRLTSLERVITSVETVSRTARIEADSHGRPLRPTLPDDVVSMIFYQKFTTYLSRNRRK